MDDEDRQPLYVQIRDILAGAIQSGELEAGAKITETSVANQFEVSRQTARHALRELGELKLIRSEPGRRGVVIAPSGHSFVKPVKADLRLSKRHEVNRSNKWEQNYDRIKSELLALSCKGSFRIVSSNLAESHGISRTILKDIQLRLVDDGIIRVDGRNWMLNRFDYDSLSQQFSVRKVLEPFALREAFPNIDLDETQQQLERLEQAKIQSGQLTSAQLEALEDDLHVHTLAQCGNPFLMDMLRRSRLVHVFNSFYFPIFHPQNLFVDEHIEVFGAILAQDLDAATEALVHHLDASLTNTCLRVKKFVDETADLRVNYTRAV